MKIPVALTIAGSDNSAGAGVQADLKTMSALGVYGLTAITCVVAEVPGKVSAIQAVKSEIVAEQIRLLFDAYPIAALKTGMLYSQEIIETVVHTIEHCFSQKRDSAFLVVDPVMVATSGDPLLQADAVKYYTERLIPLAGLVTPNLDEVRTLLGRPVKSVSDMHHAATELVARYRTAFLIKGGHLREKTATDLLLVPGGEIQEFSAPYVPGISTHGTGCTYSAAITAGMAKGMSLYEAVAVAKEYVTRAINHFLRWEYHGRQTDALNHLAV